LRKKRGVPRGTALAVQSGVANQPSSLSTPLSLQNVRKTDRPVQDEWGLFDPKQAGLEALLKKLQSSPDQTPKK
jgi:hypothetical protein